MPLPIPDMPESRVILSRTAIRMMRKAAIDVEPGTEWVGFNKILDQFLFPAWPADCVRFMSGGDTLASRHYCSPQPGFEIPELLMIMAERIELRPICTPAGMQQIIRETLREKPERLEAELVLLLLRWH